MRNASITLEHISSTVTVLTIRVLTYSAELNTWNIQNTSFCLRSFTLFVILYISQSAIVVNKDTYIKR